MEYETQRDCFAAVALQGLLASCSDGGSYRVESAAEYAYEYADAMLAQRDKRRAIIMTASEATLVESIVQSAQAHGVALPSLAQALQAVAQDPSALAGYSTPSGLSAEREET